MTLCRGGNLTIIVKTMKIKGIIDIENNRIKGQYGVLMDDALDNYRHLERDCTLLGTNEFGYELPNKSYTGALGLLQNKLGDLYFLPTTQFFLKDFIEQSGACVMDRSLVAHRIENERKTKEIDFVELAMNFEIRIKLFLMLFSTLFMITLISLAQLSTQRVMIVKLVTNFFHFKNNFKHPATKIGLVLFFYNLFFFFFKLIVSSQISISKTILDTSYIINSMDKLLKTDSVVCFLKNDVEIRMAEQSPDHHPMKRIYEEKIFPKPQLYDDGSESRHCLLSLEKIDQVFDFKNKVLFINEPSLYGFIASFVAPNPNVDYFISEKALFETVSVYCIQKGLSYLKRQIIEFSNMIKLQSGISYKSYSDSIWLSRKTIGENSKIYNTLNHYISENTHFRYLRFSFLEGLVQRMLIL